MQQAQDTPGQYEYGPAEKRGYIFNLQPIQLISLAATSGGVIALMLLDRMPLASLVFAFGLLWTILPISPLPPFLFTWHDGRAVPILKNGRPAVLWTPLIWSWAHRRLNGDYRWASAAHLDQVVELGKWGSPGEAVLDPSARGYKERAAARRQQPESVRGLTILQVTAFGGGMDLGVVNDPAERTFAAYVEVKARDYALLGSAERVRLNDLLGGIHERYEDADSPVSRVQIIERTTPEDGEALARAYTEHRVEGDGLDRVHESYAELVNQAAPLAQRHECYVGIKIDLRRQAASREAKRRGAGYIQRGACLLMLEEIGVLIQNLIGAELTVLGALPPRRLGEVIRFGYDPEQRGVVADRDREAPDAEEGLDLDRAWPSYSEERLAYYRTDSGYHITGHIREWPRRPVSSGFLRPLLLETTKMRTFALTYQVRPGTLAEREFTSSATNDSLTKNIRDRWGFRDTPKRAAQRENVLRAEQEAAEGYVVIAWSGYVTCSGRTLEEAEDSWVETVSRASASNLEVQRLYGIQEAAFTYTLPLARGIA